MRNKLCRFVEVQHKLSGTQSIENTAWCQPLACLQVLDVYHTHSLYYYYGTSGLLLSVTGVVAGFIPARALVFVNDRHSVDSSVNNGLTRRSGGDKPRRYIFAKSFWSILKLTSFREAGLHAWLIFKVFLRFWKGLSEATSTNIQYSIFNFQFRLVRVRILWESFHFYCRKALDAVWRPWSPDRFKN